MRTIFESRYNKDANYYNDLLSNSTFILDTNVLLSLYRYSESTREYFLDTLERVKDKLWMPNQVGNEFFTNRLTIISEQIKSYTAFKKELGEIQRKLENKKNHPFITDKTSENFNASLEEVYSDLKTSQEKYECLINNDIVLNRILDLYENRVGNPYSEDRINELIKIGRERYTKQIPPGYMDFAKSGGGENDDNLHGYNKIRPYGDYIIWKQVTDYSKDKSNTIIITDDIKEDWYVRAQGKTIGPRHELLAEFKELTGKTLHVYQSDMFIEKITTLLGIAKNQGAVDEIKASNLTSENKNNSFGITVKHYSKDNTELNSDKEIWIKNTITHSDYHKENDSVMPDLWKEVLSEYNSEDKNHNFEELLELQSRLKEIKIEMMDISLLIDRISDDDKISEQEKTLNLHSLFSEKTSLQREINSIKRRIKNLFK